MRVIICGGRDFNDWKAMCVALTDFALTEGPITHVVQGGADGADLMAGEWAHLTGIPCTCIPAKWADHGKAAGPIRNQAMLDSGVDAVVAFPGGRGTADMVARARKAGVRVIEVEP